MQPCQVCGSVSINAAGYCAQCGTFRGVPGQPPSGQAGGYPGQPPQAGPGYPPGGGAPGYPTSGAAGYPGSGGPAYPTSGYPGSGGPAYPGSAPPAGYPTSGGGYPTAYPAMPTPTPPKRSFTVPLVALASTLVVLVLAIVIVFATKGDDEPVDPVADPTASATARPTATAAPTDDGNDGNETSGATCMVGTWRVTSHREEVNNEEFGGKLTFRGGEGAVTTLNADGTGKNDYGSQGTAFNSTYQGKPLVLKIRGYVTFSYRLVGGQVKLSDPKSYAEAGIFLDGEQLGQWIDFKPSNDTANYTCEGDRMTQENVLYTTEFTRAD